LSTLTYREEKVLRMRFGIGENNKAGQFEGSKEFDATRERIHQIEVNALRVLRQANQGNKLRAFLSEKS
jgi:RNA polymerase primary sigma factor